MPVGPAYRPDTLHAELGAAFFDPVRPAEFPRLELRFRNERWAQRVGLGELTDAEWRAHFGRFEPLPGAFPQPLALRYHGHQFDNYNADLGDGRGFLFAQLRDARGRLLDLGTKGSGTTPYSRGGDGRLTLKGGVREILATEMLEALGVSTSKTFSLFETGERLIRGDEPSPTRSSVLVRLGHGHVRFGTFQRLAYARDVASIRKLVRYCCQNYFDGLAGDEDDSDATIAFFGEVVRRSARLCAQWMNAGFVHGVLNSDNMVITGESFDYGPYRFLPELDGEFTAAYFDHTGLYCYGRQPLAVAKNLARLADSVLPLTSQTRLQAALDEFAPLFERADQAMFLAQLGLGSRGFDDDQRLLEACRTFLARRRTPFARFFFDWFCGSASQARADSGAYRQAYESAEFRAVQEQLLTFQPERPDRLAHPYFHGRGPCTLLIDEVEAIWAAIDARDDFAPLMNKVEQIRAMGSALALCSDA